MATKIPTTIADYNILPIIVPPTKAYSVQAKHYLYVRQHNPKIASADDERSLFLVNVPIDSTSAHFRALFSHLVGAGRFESITFEGERKHVSSETTSLIKSIQKPPPSSGNKKRKRAQEIEEHNMLLSSDAFELPKIWDRGLQPSGSTAVAVMVDVKSVESVLKAIRKAHKSQDFPIWGQTPDGNAVSAPSLGSARYLTHHALQYPDPSVLQAHVDLYMTAFNAREVAAAAEAKRARNEPDEDGFVTVTRGGRTGPARKAEAEEARRKELAKEEEKKKSMGDFYRFQGRERRKEEQGELVRRFEEDRKKVEDMRNKRKSFRPEK